MLVALADNQYQGIIPVPKAIGNGDDPMRNLYWGAGYGLRTFFKKSPDWELVSPCRPWNLPVLERCVFRNRHDAVYVVADAYRGREIKQALWDLFAFSGGNAAEDVPVGDTAFIRAGGASDLIAYVGHDGLMDFSLDHLPAPKDARRRDVFMIACASKSYFANPLRPTGAKPLLWTTGLMAPEAYVIEAALAGWARKETGDQIRSRAAVAYDKYQHCGLRASMHLFATGW
ncbi:MAG TPA: hypothetical protein VGL53_18555 [Bryobacteraceae bacterium]